MPDDTLRLAVLIDADNASPAVIGDILAEVSKLGIATASASMGTLPPPILIAGALSWRTTRSSRSSNFVIPWERMRVTVL